MVVLFSSNVFNIFNYYYLNLKFIFKLCLTNWLTLVSRICQTHWVSFVFFLRELMMFWPPVLVQCFGGSTVENYRPISITSVLSKVFLRLVSVRLGQFIEAVVSYQQPSLLIGKVWVPVNHLCACPTCCKVHWRVDRRLGSCRLISAQPLIESTVREFFVSF